MYRNEIDGQIQDHESIVLTCQLVLIFFETLLEQWQWRRYKTITLPDVFYYKNALTAGLSDPSA